MGNKQLTQKQENFTLVYVETGEASIAYRQCYGTEITNAETVHRAAFEVLHNPKVAARVFELQEAAREAHGVTVDTLCTELDEARELAIESTQPSAAVTTIMGKAKLHGLGVEKRQTHITGYMTFDEAEAILDEACIDYD